MPETSPLPRLLLLAIVSLGALGLMAARWFPEALLQTAHCPLRELTGIPCPTCGGTHSAVSLAQGRWLDAWHSNPLIAGSSLAGLVAVGYAGLATWVPRLRRSLLMGARERCGVRILAAAALAGTWIYLLCAGS